jgi:hypothetical protein
MELTLILSIPALNLLMHTLLHLALQNPSADALFIPGSLEDMSCVDPVIRPPSHNVNSGLGGELVHRDLRILQLPTLKATFRGYAISLRIVTGHRLRVGAVPRQDFAMQSRRR